MEQAYDAAQVQEVVDQLNRQAPGEVQTDTVYLSSDEEVLMFVKNDDILCSLLPLISPLNNTSFLTAEDIAIEKLEMSRIMETRIAFSDEHDMKLRMKMKALEAYIRRRLYDSRGGYRGNRLLERRTHLKVESGTPQREGSWWRR